MILVARILGEDIVREISETKQASYDLSKRKLAYLSYSRKKSRSRTIRNIGLGADEILKQRHASNLRSIYKKILCARSKVHSFC